MNYDDDDDGGGELSPQINDKAMKVLGFTEGDAKMLSSKKRRSSRKLMNKIPGPPSQPPPGKMPLGPPPGPPPSHRIEDMSGEEEEEDIDIGSGLKSKVWKDRFEAWEALKKVYDRADVVNDEFIDHFAGGVSDSNARCQMSAMFAVQRYLERLERPDPALADIIDEIIPAIIKKGFGSMKAQANVAATEIILQFIELGCDRGVFPHLLKSSADKQWKVAAGVGTTVVMALKSFGPRVVTLQNVTPFVEKLFGSANGKVREQAVALCREIYRWIGDVFVEQLETMKLTLAQVKEVQNSFEDVEESGKVKPTRRLRGTSSRKAGRSSKASSTKNRRKSAATNDYDDDDDDDEKFDPMSLLEARDVLAELSKDWESAVFHKQWKMKKERLEELLDLAKTPKIKMNPRMHDIIGCLKRLLSDINLIVVQLAVKCLTALAKGVKSEVGSIVRACVGPLLELLKDKKSTLNAAVNECLDVCYNDCVNLTDVLDAIESALNHKVTKVKLDTSKWLHRSLEQPKPYLKSCANDLGMMFLQNLQDKEKDIREISYMCLVSLMRAVGKKQLRNVLKRFESIDSKRASNAMSESGLGGGDDGGGDDDDDNDADNNAPPPAKASAKRRRKRPTNDDSAVAAASKKPSKPAGGGVRRSKTPGNRGRSNNAAVDDDGGGDEVKAVSLMDYDDAKDQLNDIVDDVTLNEEGIESKKWKEQLEAVDSLKTSVEMLGDDLNQLTNAFLSVIAVNPSFKPTNAMVCAKVYECCASLANHSSKFSKNHAVLILPFLVGKMSDRKVAKAGKECLTALSEACGPEFIVRYVNQQFTKVKSPVAQAALIQWVCTCVTEFGVVAVNTNNVINMAKKWLASANKTVRDEAMEVLVAVYRQVGEPLREKMCDGLKPLQSKDLHAAFDNVPEDEVGQSTATRAQKGKQVATKVKMNDVIPKVDISPMITQSLLEKLQDKNWKNRKESLDAIDDILIEANHRIGSKDGGLFAALKLRLSDTNKNLVRQTLVLIGTLSIDMGPPVAKYAKYIAASILSCFGDSKRQIVEAASKCLREWLSQAGLPSMIKTIPHALESKAGRLELLTEVVPQVEAAQTQRKLDMNEWVGPTIACCQDRAAPVRELAEQLLYFVTKRVGYRIVSGQVSNLKKAARLSLDPLLAKVRERLDEEPSMSSMGDENADDDDDNDGKSSSKKIKRSRSRRKDASDIPKSSSKPSSLSRSSSKSKLKSGKGNSKHGLAEFTKKINASAAGADDSDLLQMCSGKDKRCRLIERRLQGAFRSWAPDEIEDLQKELEQCVSSNLCKLMFSKDFKSHVKALDILMQQGLSTYMNELDSMSDLILRWTSWKIADANTSVLLKALEFLQSWFDLLRENEVQISPGEALTIVPHLANEALGSNKDRFRSSTHMLIRTITTCYPKRDIFIMLQNTLVSKNKRVVAECLDEMGNMILQYTVSGVCVPGKSLPDIAKQVGSSDNGVRTAALGALQNAYAELGDSVWNYLGGKDGTRKCRVKLSGKQRDMMNERFKRTKVTGPQGNSDAEPPSSAHVDTTHSDARQRMNSKRVFSTLQPKRRRSSGATRRKNVAKSPIRETSASPVGPSLSSSQTLKRSNTFERKQSVDTVIRSGTVDSSVFDLEFDSISVPRSKISSVRGGSTTPTTTTTTTDITSYSRMERGASMSSIRSLDDNNDDFSTDTPAISSTPYMDTTTSNDMNMRESSLENPEVWAHIQSINGTHDETERIESLRTIWQLIKKDGIHRIQPHTDALVHCLIKQIHVAFETHHNGEGLRLRLCKYALNLLLEVFQEPGVAEDMTAITHESLSRELLSHLTNITTLMNTESGRHVVKSLNILMLKVLENADRTSSFHVLLKFLKEDVDEGFNKLAVKCLLKITKALNNTVKSLNLVVILKAIHEYFLAHPRETVSRSDTTMRTVRTTLNEIVKLLGHDILQYLSLVHHGPDADILYFVNTMLAHRTPDNGPSSLGLSEDDGGSQRLANIRARMADKRRGSQTLPVASSYDNDMKVNTSSSSSSDNMNLDTIFEMLHKKESTQEALHNLYRYKQQHPDVDLTNYFKKTSTVFQMYIERGLKRVAQQQERGAGLSSNNEPLSPLESMSPGTMSPRPLSPATTSDFRRRLAKLGNSSGNLSARRSADTNDALSPKDGSSLEYLRNRMKATASPSPPTSNDKSNNDDDGDDDPLARIRNRVNRIKKL